MSDLAEVMKETAESLQTATHASINEAFEDADCSHGDFACFLLLSLMRNDSPADLAKRYGITRDAAIWIHSAMMVAAVSD